MVVIEKTEATLCIAPIHASEEEKPRTCRSTSMPTRNPSCDGRLRPRLSVASLHDPTAPSSQR